ncbi:hypothetical protein CRE_05214 [Caenorhabditis remanei]|uniref:Uncharacterized protein n=1 Tax=Caenorhabditis remanei TaxID=31234 RepID=E3NEA8_CAERE|nr:hypothetical protein CRE_05214 [Caenorhabditis remanei]
MVEIGGDSVLLEDRNGQCLLYEIRRMDKPQWTIVSKEPSLSINVTSLYVCLKTNKNTVRVVKICFGNEIPWISMRKNDSFCGIWREMRVKNFLLYCSVNLFSNMNYI